ncbi:hypothetical protein [Cryobacterium sp. TMT4-10]|uniref:hypothetical protein n=1 Tax=Cryobacterium sp. TMT4-10 TaxID=1259256 RepID=UPI00106A3061|nr:hypothetical protein [Cryobacterium sp. TMT4-10]TFD20873.1 hypothetical protein E3T42_00835 [Cryobacterium sp. TMT4-10]
MNMPPARTNPTALSDRDSEERAQYALIFVDWVRSLISGGAPAITSAKQSVDLVFGGCFVAAAIGQYAADGLITTVGGFFESVQARVDEGALTASMCDHDGEHDAQQNTLIRVLIASVAHIAMDQPTAIECEASCTDPAYSVALIVNTSLHDASARTGVTPSSILDSVHSAVQECRH